MEPRTLESTKRYRVLIEAVATEGRMFRRGDLLSPEDAPGEIESLLHAKVIEPIDGVAPTPPDVKLV